MSSSGTTEITDTNIEDKQTQEKKERGGGGGSERGFKSYLYMFSLLNHAPQKHFPSPDSYIPIVSSSL